MDMSHCRDNQLRDLVVSTAPGGDLLFDLYLPPRSAGSPLPVVLWLHGGGWFTGDRTLCPDLATRAEATGLAYASIEYRLSGDALFPAQLLDVRAAIRFIRSNAARWNLDPSSMGLWGASAGGHLAALAGVTGHLLHVPGEDPAAVLSDASVRAVSTGYPPVDLSEVVTDSMTARPTANPLTFPESRLLGALPSERRELARQANPLTYITAAAPAFLLAHGTADPLVDQQQSVALHEALVAAGVNSELYLLEGYKHGFLNPPGRLDIEMRSAMDDGRLETEGWAMARHRGHESQIRNSQFSFETIDAFFQNHLHALDRSGLSRSLTH